MRLGATVNGHIHLNAEAASGASSLSIRRLAACRCAEEASNVYAEFWRNLGEDYTNEFAAQSKLSGGLATSAFTPSGPKPRS